MKCCRCFFLLTIFLLSSLQAQKTHDYCAPCHGEQVTDFKTHPHFAKGLSCDICHGESLKHRTSTGAAPPDRVAAPDEVPALCGTCHAPEGKQYAASKHGKLVLAQAKVKSPNCATCHGVHNLRTVKQTEQQCNRCHVSLPASCKPVGCVTCHKPHLMLAAK